MDVVYFDLWENEEQEKSGWITRETYDKLRELASAGYVLVPLGKWQQKALAHWNFYPYEVEWGQPHPAARRRKDIYKLERGLLKLAAAGKSVCLIGGHPLGRPVPFDMSTRSGRVLRKMVSEVGLKKDVRLDGRRGRI